MNQLKLSKNIIDEFEKSKWYTPKEIWQYCLDITKETFDFSKIEEIIDPSAGSGTLVKLLEYIPFTAIDIEPGDTIVEKQDLYDFIKDMQEIQKRSSLYLNNCLVMTRFFFGNGSDNNAWQKDARECFKVFNKMALIVPRKEYNINSFEDLGVKLIKSVQLITDTGYDTKFAFNIYKKEN